GCDSFSFGVGPCQKSQHLPTRHVTYRTPRRGVTCRTLRRGVSCRVEVSEHVGHSDTLPSEVSVQHCL
ncbi:hypothetical protein T07_10555, partial [Trichinella nelsoni]